MKKVVCSLLALSLSVCSFQTTFADNISSQANKTRSIYSNSIEACNNINKETQLKEVQKLIKKELDSINKKTPVWRRVLAWPFKFIWNMITSILSSLAALTIAGGGAYFYFSRKAANLKSTSTKTDNNVGSNDKVEQNIDNSNGDTTDGAQPIATIETNEEFNAISINVDPEFTSITRDLLQEIKEPTTGGTIDRVLTEFSQPTPGGTIDLFFNELTVPTKGGFFDQFIECFKEFNSIFAEFVRSAESKLSIDFTYSNPKQYALPSGTENKEI